MNTPIEQSLIDWYVKDNGICFDDEYSLQKLLILYNKGYTVNRLMVSAAWRWVTRKADKTKVISHFESILKIQEEKNNFENTFTIRNQ